jgi:hypothetical protein
MIEFISYKSFSDVIAYIAQDNNLNLYESLTSAPFRVQVLSSWDELLQHRGEDSLFGNVINELVVWDYSQISLSREVFGVISSADSLLIHREMGNISAGDKKIIKEHASLVELIKPNSRDIEVLLRSYSDSNDGDLPKNVRDYIARRSESYDVAMSLLYIAEMSEYSMDALREYENNQRIGLFMLPWREHNLLDDAKIWIHSTQRDEIQLALSLLMSKTLKWSPSKLRKQIIDVIVHADYQLKTYTRSDEVYFKSIIWHIAHLAD